MAKNTELGIAEENRTSAFSKVKAQPIDERLGVRLENPLPLSEWGSSGLAESEGF